MRITSLAFLLALALPIPAFAVDQALLGFTPNGNFSPVTAPSGSSSAATPLPAGVVVMFQNSDVNDAWLNLGGPSVTAAPNQIHLRAKSTIAFVPGARTHYAVYGIGGTANIVTTGGSGTPVGF
jgi:hypothetical protein